MDFNSHTHTHTHTHKREPNFLCGSGTEMVEKSNHKIYFCMMGLSNIKISGQGVNEEKRCIPFYAGHSLRVKWKKVEKSNSRSFMSNPISSEPSDISGLRHINKTVFGASLVAQWLRIRLPRQGARVQALVREDPICCGATKPVCHNYWACALEPTSHNYWNPCA